ncbi:MAG: large repetitive protein, partial [Candidatus Cloacimonadota bacterium]|nr:large repetitive protein [Candidatus Cloacimonadota bacterium]
MKHSVLIILLLALVWGAFSNLNAQVTLTLGEGTATNTETGAPTPYGTYFKNFHQQYLVLASELEDIGG